MPPESPLSNSGSPLGPRWKWQLPQATTPCIRYLPRSTDPADWAWTEGARERTQSAPEMEMKERTLKAVSRVARPGHRADAQLQGSASG